MFFLFVCLAMLGLSYSMRDLRCRAQASLVVTSVLLSSSGSWACCPAASCGTLVPQPGIESASPAFEGGFLTTDYQGSTQPTIFIWLFKKYFSSVLLRSESGLHILVPEVEVGRRN